MKKTFKFSIIVNGNAPVFLHSEAPGVIATVEIDYYETERQFSSMLFANKLLNKQQEIIKEYVNSRVEEVK